MWCESIDHAEQSSARLFSTALVKRFLRNGIRFVVFDLDSFSKNY